MKFTKTEQKVIDYIKRYGVYSYNSGVTGSRTVNALLSLQKKGIVKLKSLHNYTLVEGKLK
jgi:hypothetical protein